jgi:hypothetical protein
MPLSHGLCVDYFDIEACFCYFILTPDSGDPIPTFIKSKQTLDWKIVKYCKGLLDIFYGLAVASSGYNDEVNFIWEIAMLVMSS